MTNVLDSNEQCAAYVRRARYNAACMRASAAATRDITERFRLHAAADAAEEEATRSEQDIKESNA